ncbi:unnamed protein product [Clavelina lepadiformis]|uniref:Major facilitator superfamily (MFS) profile domain-containing protein n=1 Tax=Clavelina lepadiformis TaxID=159417 RepID=A0ABP0GL34_CLALP
MSLKNLLNHHEFGLYEKRLCFLLFLSSIPNIFPTMQVIVNQYTPPHSCDLTKQVKQFGSTTNESLEEFMFNITIPFETNVLSGTKKRSSCNQYNVSLQSIQSFILGKVNSSYFLHQNTSTNIVPCTSFQFQGEEKSAVTEFGLICNQAWQRPLFTTMFMLGMLISSFLGGFISDRIGRKVTFLVFTYAQFVIAFITSFVNNTILYGIMVFLAGASTLVNYAAASVIGSEFVHPDLRSFTYFALGTGYGVGYMLLAPVMYFIRDWRWFMRFAALVGIPYISYIWLIDETPTWLAANKKYKQLRNVLNKISEMNQKQKTREEIMETLSLKTSVMETSSHSWMEIVKSLTMMGRLIIVGFSWLAVSMTYFAISFNSNNLSGDRFMNVFYAGAMELLSVAGCYFFVQYCGRRKSYMISMGVCGISIALSPFATKWNGELVVFISMLSKLMSGLTFALIFIYTLEIFPTYYRHFLLGICSSCARLGGIISPYIIYAGEEGETLAPSLCMAGITLLSVALYIFLPETNGQPLPQSVEDAVKMKGILNFTCFASAKHSRKEETENLKEQL